MPWRIGRARGEPPAPWVGGVVLALTLLAGACELEQVSLVDAEDVVVAEAYAQVGMGRGIQSTLNVFLHRTLGGVAPGSHPVPGARVTVTSSDGRVMVLAEGEALGACATSTPVDGTGTCYASSTEDAATLRPGQRLTLSIDLDDGRHLESSTRIPGDFSLLNVAVGGGCKMEPATPLEVTWSASAGAWAYITETSIQGIRAALAPAGISVDEDPLHLLGVSVSASDTTIVFPGELGLFNRGELDRDVAVVLQEGLPAGVWARVTVAAVDRNYVNWARGGSFNPSGRVRVPSVRGDGIGVFGSVVVWPFDVVVDPRPDGSAWDAEACGDAVTR